ncbi:6,7-dimethyl-8-ribityllumazine synthase [uncultured Candidatus Thioglobus sp.]|nr:6,7-dimethyl-8-ribityllumazine synthase [uncultured Candidatus Thioglobus sp.]
MNYKFNKEANQTFLEEKKIAILVGYFYQEIGDKLLAAALETLDKYGIDEDNVDVFYVPGAFEIPLLAKKTAESGKYNGIVTLGAVIDGETPHFDFVCNECARGVANVAYQTGVPTAFGVLTTSNMAQTIGRAGGYKGNKGKEATMAMIEMLYLLDKAQ